MPIVTFQVTREGTTPGAASVTSEQKAALIKGASQLLLDVLNKPLEATFVVRHRRGRNGQLGVGRTTRCRISEKERKSIKHLKPLPLSNRSQPAGAQPAVLSCIASRT
jgi:phenylpyruvate tautomerase PptA (4-oxalocrotonate tautomerase family)